MLQAGAKAVRYLWRSTPCGPLTFGCPIYLKVKALGALTGGGPAALARSWPPAANGAGAGAAAQQQQRGATPPELDRRLQVGSERRKKRVSFKLADDVRLAAAEGVGESVSWAAENARSLAHTL